MNFDFVCDDSSASILISVQFARDLSSPKNTLKKYIVVSLIRSHPFMTSTRRRGGGGQAQVDACGRGGGGESPMWAFTQKIQVLRLRSCHKVLILKLLVIRPIIRGISCNRYHSFIHSLRRFI